MTETAVHSSPGRTRPALALLAFVLAVAAVAVFGGLFSATAGETYAALDRPAWAPPAWLFGPAWTVLYVLIALSGWWAWRAGGGLRAQPVAFAAYGVQLVLNAAWTPLFFGLGAFGAALADILLLGVAILVTVVLFARSSRVAAVLLVPYLLWVAYATALNAALL